MDRASKVVLVFNYLVFQLGWFLLVLTQSPWALIWALAFVAIHLRWMAAPKEWLSAGAVMVLGLAIDTAWQHSPWVQFNGTGWPLPLWLAGLWLMFPLTLNHSLGWLRSKPLLQVLFGVFGGGGSYIAGAQLGAAHLEPQAYWLLPLSWGLLLPLFYGCMRFEPTTARSVTE